MTADVSYKDKWILIEHLMSKNKTEVFKVTSICSQCDIGVIHWYPSWRHYTYEPTIEFQIELSDRCLRAIAQFVEFLNQQHKLKALREKEASPRGCNDGLLKPNLNPSAKSQKKR